MSNDKAQMQNECQRPKTDPFYPNIIGICCLLLVNRYLFVICLTSTALAHFAHLAVGLGIYAFGFDLSFGFCHLKLFGKAGTIPGKADGL